MIALNKYLITTRPAEKNTIIEQNYCFQVVNVPVTALRPNKEFQILEVERFNPDVAIFTSSYGVKLYFDYFDGTLGGEVAVISIGNETASELSSRGRRSLVPEVKTSNGVIELLKELFSSAKRVAVFVSSRSNRVIQGYLEEQNIGHLVSTLYHGEELPGKDFAYSLLQGDCIGAVITSPFEAQTIFNNILGPSEREILLSGKKIFSIGKTTSDELKKLGVPVSKPEGKSDLEKLVDSISKEYCR